MKVERGGRWNRRVEVGRKVEYGPVSGGVGEGVTGRKVEPAGGGGEEG